MSCLIDAPSGFSAFEMFSRSAPESVCLADAFGDRVVASQTFLDAFRQDRLDQSARSSGERPEEISISTCQGQSPASGGAAPCQNFSEK